MSRYRSAERPSIRTRGRRRPASRRPRPATTPTPTPDRSRRADAADAQRSTRPRRPRRRSSISGLVKRYGDTVAVEGVDLEVRAGLVLRHRRPERRRQDDDPVDRDRPAASRRRYRDDPRRPTSGSDPAAAKRSLGVLPDRLRLFDRLTGAQLLYYSATLRGLDGATARKRSADLATAFGLHDALGRLVSDYSVGMTKKIALAAAIIHSPRVLVLDEPFESVDPVSAATVTEILQRYVAGGGTVLLSSHSMDLVERICDSVAVIVDGHVLAERHGRRGAGRPLARGAVRRARRRPRGHGGHGMVAQLLRLRLQTIANAVRFGPRRLSRPSWRSCSRPRRHRSPSRALVSGLRVDAARRRPRPRRRRRVAAARRLPRRALRHRPSRLERPAAPRRARRAGADARPSASLSAAPSACPTLALLVISTGLRPAVERGHRHRRARRRRRRAWPASPRCSWPSSPRRVNCVVLTSTRRASSLRRRGRPRRPPGRARSSSTSSAARARRIRAAPASSPTPWPGRPFGAALALPGHAAAGETGRVVADVVDRRRHARRCSGSPGGPSSRGRFIDRPAARPSVDERDGLGWFEFVRATPDRCRRRPQPHLLGARRPLPLSLVIIPFLPLLVVPLGIAGRRLATARARPGAGHVPAPRVPAAQRRRLRQHRPLDARRVQHAGSGRPGRPARAASAHRRPARRASARSWRPGCIGDSDALPPSSGSALGLLLTGLGLSSIMSAALPVRGGPPAATTRSSSRSRTGRPRRWAQTRHVRRRGPADGARRLVRRARG